MTQRFKVKPLVRCALDDSVVEVESVDVHVGCHVGVSLRVASFMDRFPLGRLETEGFGENRRATRGGHCDHRAGQT